MFYDIGHQARSAAYAENLAGAAQPFQLERAGRLDVETTAAEQVPRRARHIKLIRGRKRDDPCGGVHSNPVRVPGHEDNLTGVTADPNLEAEPGRCADHPEAAPDGAHRTVEHRHEAVPGGVELAPAMVSYLLPHGRVVREQKVTPCLVADALDRGCGADDVAEQQRDHEAVIVVRRAREHAGARPLVSDDHVITDHPCIVPWWDLVRIARQDFHRGPVVELHMHRSFETDPDVPIQARVGANDRPNVVAPTPPRIKGQAPDLALIERDALYATVPEFAHRLRLIEALPLEPRHGREANASP